MNAATTVKTLDPILLHFTVPLAREKTKIQKKFLSELSLETSNRKDETFSEVALFTAFSAVRHICSQPATITGVKNEATK